MKQVQEQEQNQSDREPFQRRAGLPDGSPSELAILAGARSGKFPNAGTLRAKVLAVLLASEDMEGTESVFAGANRLSTVIRALTRRYRWPIERHEFATNTSDGRAAWASAYCLPQESINQAHELGAAAWIEEVRSARANRRSKRHCGSHAI